MNIVRIPLPDSIAAERFAFRAALARLNTNGAPMTHSAHITDGHLCVRGCTDAQAAVYAAALV